MLLMHGLTFAETPCYFSRAVFLASLNHLDNTIYFVQQSLEHDKIIADLD